MQTQIKIRKDAVLLHLGLKVDLFSTCIFIVLIATTMAIAYTTTTSEVMTNDTCLEHCTYVEPKLECYGCIPQWVPNGTKEVFLVKLRPNKFLFTRFCGINWPYITSLAITTEDNVSYRLRNRVFHCLGFLHTLRLNSPYLLSFDYGTFIGLTNLTTFDISGCKRLSILYVFKILSLPNNFPILNKILLSSIDPSQQQIIDQNFIQALSTRPINYIDLSSIYLGLSFTSADNLCKTLHTLVIRDASLFLWGGFQSLKKCSSLRVYDNTGTGKLTGLMCVNDTWFELGYRFFRAVKVLISNRKIQSPLPKTEVANCTLDYLRDSSVEELHFAENNLPSFEFKLKNAIINFLNLSHNKIEHINSDAVRYLPALARLDISNNDLAKAKAFDTTFSHLFKFNIELIEIDLSVNNLEFLPNETFVHNNHLELLNLSSNKFDQIHFHFWNLPNLTTIDMRTNTIVSLDLHSRQSIDHWHSLKLENNKSVNLLLYGNPFSCSCSSLDFVKWLVASPIFSSTVHQYHCYIEGQRMPLTLNAAQGDCDRIQRQRLRTKLVSTLPPICALVLLVLALVLYRRYKRRQWIRLQDDRIRLLRENEAMFPVFLSHSSDDYEFVRDNILKPLQAGLRKLTKIDRDLVCHAGGHFVPGRTIMAEMFRCLEDCPVFIAVVSESFCASRYCQHEIETAHTDGKPIILIFKEHVPEDKMDQVTRKIFNTFTRVKCVFGENGVELQPSWDVLCKSIIELIK